MALLALWNPNIQFLKTDGTINAGGKLVVTDHNDAESVPANYSDADGTTLNSSPIILDALGRATCYIDDRSTYDLYVKDADGATLWTVPEMTPGAETIVVRAGFSVSSNDSSVAVVISVDPNGVTNYDLSIQGEIDRAEGAEGDLAEDIADEIDRAKTAEKAAKTEVVAGDNITVTKTVGADGQDVYTIDGEDGDSHDDEVIAAALNDLNARLESLEDMESPDDLVAKTVSMQEFPLVGGKSMVLLGPSAPDSVPSYEGQFYFDLTNKSLYFAVGQSSASDWVPAKKKQSAVTQDGSTIKTVTRIVQDANGVMSATFEDIRSASTTQKGVVQLSDSTASASSETAATSAAVKQAYDLAASNAISWMTSAEAVQLWTDAWNAAT